MPGDRFGSFTMAVAALGGCPQVSIVLALHLGPRRYNELAGVLANFDEAVLNAGLHDLDEAGLVARRVDSGPPLRVLYVLTDRGAEIAPALHTLTTWLNSKTGPPQA